MTFISPNLFDQCASRATTGNTLVLTSPGSQTIPLQRSNVLRIPESSIYPIPRPEQCFHWHQKLPLNDIENLQILLSKPWLNEYMQKLREFSRLGSDWDEYGAAAPNSHAIRNTEDILKKLYDANLSPSRMAPSVEEGVVMSFSNGHRYAVIDCYNDGPIVVGLSSKGSKPNVWEIISESDLDDAIERIETHLHD